MDVKSYVVYGKVLKAQDFLDKKTGLSEMERVGLSYFFASSEFQEYLIVGFCLGENNGYDRIPFVEIRTATPQMEVELEHFFKRYGIQYFIEDFQTMVFAYEGY